ncbi:GntR family transcriptional regulator [Lactobacillus amylovorus]|uniref:GntR family transcriptional regulator n=1 Tax=Lactobacillus amylovorus TaxID=1604 RepID=UPI00232DEA03|nr:GntR family transcriptional regulator [Lactobacillus amylovorus]MDB6234481.1 GntR family transcriptional regulator [Lactobacillus amylovorus]
METNTVPLYQKMMQALIHKIEIGALKENDKLPSEQELGKQFNISRITVRKALEELQNINFIYKKQGQGSFVLERSKRNKHYRYLHIGDKIHEMGAKASSKILEFNIIADERHFDIKEKMGL